MKLINTDIVVIGGGIAGLWLFRTLNMKGYKAVLLENSCLGGGQTTKSQGIIHGGTKYTLSGSLTKASQCIAAMPDRWRKSLAGQGELNLTGVTILSDHQYLWASGGLSSRLATFFASKALRGRVDQLKPCHFPEIFQHQYFRGKLYKLNEVVLDTCTVVESLVKGLEDRCIKVDWDNDTQLVTDKNNIGCININQSGVNIRLQAERYVIAAGEGTAKLLALWGRDKPDMQLRPLHMPMVRHSYPEPLFAHCIGMKPVPRITITSHPAENGKHIWYLGGEIAEEGVNSSSEELIITAKRELKVLLPWVNLDGAEWASLKVNRAEPKQGAVLRPDTAFCHAVANGIVTWPTKLALAPNLSEEVVKMLECANIKPSGDNGSFHLPKELHRPEISPPFWSDYFD